MASPAAAAAAAAAAVPLWVQWCGTMAPFASVLVCMSPIPTIQRINRERKVGSLPLLPYSTMIINSMLWFAYGLLKKEIKIYSCNGTGLILGVVYFVHYIKFSPAASSTLPGSVQQHVQAILITLIFTVFSMMTPSTDPGWLIGKVGMVFCVGLFASPLSVVRVVIVSRSAKSIPLPFTLACLVNCFLWTTFGWFQANDANIYVPNFLGLCLSVIQLALKVKFDGDLLAEFISIGGAKDGGKDHLLPLAKAPLSAPPTEAR
jgi:solute carrier family 50 protein (sugar transporter)